LTKGFYSSLSSVRLHISSISCSCAAFSFTWDEALSKVEEKVKKENQLELSPPWNAKSQARKSNSCLFLFTFLFFCQNYSAVVLRAASFLSPVIQ